MEPVPVTHKVRRTVRMAVALVVGQAMLCALIGWLTLGRSRPDNPAPPGSAVVDQLAVPPLAGPAPAPSPSLSRSPAISSTRERRPASTPNRAPRGPSTTTPVPPEPISLPPEEPAIVPPVPPPATITTPSPSVAAGPTVSTVPSPVTTPSPPAKVPDDVQQPVRVGDECRPEGASGRTADGELVKCVRDGRHRARWKIV